MLVGAGGPFSGGEGMGFALFDRSANRDDALRYMRFTFSIATIRFFICKLYSESWEWPELL